MASGGSRKAIAGHLSMNTNDDWHYCPCCGFASEFAGPDFHYGIGDICPYCGWEIESYERRFPDAPGGANGGCSLRNWQHAFFLRYEGRAAWESGAAPRASKLEHDPNWSALAAPFDGWPIVDPDLPLNDATCPCCGYRSIHAGRARCPICAWVFGPGSSDPELRSFVGYGFVSGGITLVEAQQNFRKLGGAHEGLKRLVRKPTRQDRKDPNWRPYDGGPKLWDAGKSTSQATRVSQNLLPLTCPCCGHRAIASDECEVCCWRYFTGHRDPRDHSKPNPVRLREAQRNFLAHGVWTLGHNEWDQPFKPPRDPDPALKDPAWRPLDETIRES